MKTTEKKLEKIEVTMQEIWAHTRPAVHVNKKKFRRKSKHRKED